MLITERAFIGFDNVGVVALRPQHGGDLIAADCPASLLPAVGSTVTRAEVRGWAAALSGPKMPIRGSMATLPRPSRVLSGVPLPQEVQHQSIKTREFRGKSGSQATLTTIPIRAAHGSDCLPGVIGG